MAKFRMLIPQKARGKLREEMWTSSAWTTEEKLDGERRIAQMLDGQVRFTGTPSRKSGVPVEKTAQLPHLSAGFPTNLDGTVLDGELIKPEGVLAQGGESKYVTAISNSSPAEAIRKQKERGWLRYVVFDCLFWKGEDIRDRPLTERREYAACAVRTWKNPHVSIVNWSCLGRSFYEEIIKAGGEGVVLKRADHVYGDHLGWVKVKKEATYDCVIIGYKEAKATSKKVSGEVSATKYAKQGLIGALVIGQYKSKDRRGRPLDMKEVGTISGMDEGWRARFTKDKKKYLGQVVEVKANGREPTGRFRHPQFVRIRTDKSNLDCIYDRNES